MKLFFFLIILKIIKINFFYSFIKLIDIIPKNIVIVGDSAGGNLATGLVNNTNIILINYKNSIDN